MINNKAKKIIMLNVILWKFRDIYQMISNCIQQKERHTINCFI